MIKLVIFDCDGVLFESTGANIAYYNAVLDRVGVPAMNPDWERQVHFLASSQVYEAMFGKGSELAEKARSASREMDYAGFFHLMHPVPGLHEVLAELKTSYRLAMATNRSTTVGEIVRRFDLEQYLELAVGILDVPRPKPHPDMLNKCLEHFEVGPASAVYIGDAETDLQAATAAGMHFVAVEEVPGAQHRVHDFRELPQQLEALTSHAS